MFEGRPRDNEPTRIERATPYQLSLYKESMARRSRMYAAAKPEPASIKEIVILQPFPWLRQPVFKPIRPSVRRIQIVVARFFGLSQAELLSRRRSPKIIFPRQIAMFLARRLTIFSTPEIGRRFADMDHTTVLHAGKKIKALRGSDPDVADQLAALERALAPGGGA